MTEADVIAEARKVAAELGDASDRGTARVLARMVVTAARGASSGFLRLAPETPTKLKLNAPREAL